MSNKQRGYTHAVGPGPKTPLLGLSDSIKTLGKRRQMLRCYCQSGKGGLASKSSISAKGYSLLGPF